VVKNRDNYNVGNQLTSNNQDNFEYDANGNLTKSVGRRGDDDEQITSTYKYDYENRLIEAVIQKEEDHLTVVTFKYDPFGRRIEKSVEVREEQEIESTKTYTYVYDNEDIILEYLTKTGDNNRDDEDDEDDRRGNGIEITRYTHGPGIDEPLAVEQNGNTYFYHADGLGSITALTDNRGRRTQTYDYDSFGNMKQSGNRIDQPYTYTGREYDSETGLYYYRARYYDATVGRFTSEDPIEFAGGINHYVYTLNNPIRFTDPYGLDVRDCYRPMEGLLWGIQYHRYLWIDGEGWGLTTADGSIGITTTEGKLKRDNATGGLGVHCVPIQVDDCQKECLKKEIDKDYKNPPNYNLITYNCHAWVSDIFGRCSE